MVFRTLKTKMAKRHVPIWYWFYLLIVELVILHLYHKLMLWYGKKIYLKHASEEIQVPSKVVVITGANTGLGKQTAIEMARRGAVVVMGCRDLVRGKVARKEIMDNSGSKTVELYELDLGDLSSVQCFAGLVLREHGVIDILINNAGIALDNLERKYTKEGWDMTMATNHLGHFLLTNLLVESLSASEIGRVVTLSSSTCILSTFDTDDLMMEKDKNLRLFGTMSYVNSKFANGLFSKSLGRRYPSIKSYCVCPGLVKTEVFRNFEKRENSRLVVQSAMNMFASEVEQAVDAILLCSLGKRVENDSGSYFRFGKRIRWKEEMFDDKTAEELWEASEKIVQLEKVQRELNLSLSISDT